MNQCTAGMDVFFSLGYKKEAFVCNIFFLSLCLLGVEVNPFIVEGMNFIVQIQSLK